MYMRIIVQFAEPKALAPGNVPRVTSTSTPIVLRGVNCRGHEDRLGNCARLPTVENCDHTCDAGAFCTNIIGKHSLVYQATPSFSINIGFCSTDKL